ncbi:MAG: tRNA (adenosine(37)-N6)-dimethylallyltransferase MiaA [Candidatus Nomurabacteria bacterium]|nr:MAG: tRNA (adenosine(37)-N6)-dimethylallyltransferase MiaA [Candidatus Nomurabacteria bacterium]
MSLTQVIIILGPTASGKSSLAIALAKRFKGEIISADSRQVYRGLDIGTGKVTKREMQSIPHYLLDIASPTRQYTVAQFQKETQKTIRKITRNNNLPIICGGTGFYIDAVVSGTTLPEVRPNKKLRKQLVKKTPAQLFHMLQKLDPIRAKSIDPQNPVRLIRAIEIAQSLGRVPQLHVKSQYDALKIGITLSKEKLHDNIHRRLHARMRQGMLAEAKRLHRQGLSYRRMEALGLEYRYLAYHLQGKLTKSEMLQQLEKAIQHYAKRQMTWFKRDKNIHWVKSAKEAQVLTRQFLKKENSPQS